MSRKLTALSFMQSSPVYMVAVLIRNTYLCLLLYLFIPQCGQLTIKGSRYTYSPPIPIDTRLYKEEETTFITKYTYWTASGYEGSSQPLFVSVKLCSCSCRCCSVRLKYKTLQTLIWWNVMVFTQIIVGHVALPVLILFTSTYSNLDKLTGLLNI